MDTSIITDNFDFNAANFTKALIVYVLGFLSGMYGLRNKKK